MQVQVWVPVLDMAWALRSVWRIASVQVHVQVQVLTPPRHQDPYTLQMAVLVFDSSGGLVVHLLRVASELAW